MVKGKLTAKERERLNDLYEAKRKSQILGDTMERLNQERIEKRLNPYPEKPGREVLYE
jgi:hypothetical protein